MGLAEYAAMDPAEWETGLSPEGARLALERAVEPLRWAEYELPPRAPESLAIWCAGNVFTAPLEWVDRFTSYGTRVLLKAPSSCPKPVRALAEAYGLELIEGHEVPKVKALLAFGSDETMEALRKKAPRKRSLHGHRVSFAVISDPASAEDLSWDLVLHDGQGCMSPTAVFVPGDAAAVAQALAEALARRAVEVPRGPMHPAQGARWRERTAAARIDGHVWEGRDWAVVLQDKSQVQLGNLPRFISVHPISSVAQLEPLASLPLSTCGTDTDALKDISALGFWRICPPGWMQRPPARTVHDGVDLLQALCPAR